MLPDAVTLDVILDVLFDDLATANEKLAPHNLKAVADPKFPGAVAIVTLSGDTVGSITPQQADAAPEDDAKEEAPAWAEPQRIDEEQDYDQITRRFIRQYAGDNIRKYDPTAAEDDALLARIRARKLADLMPTPEERAAHQERMGRLVTRRREADKVESTSDERTVNNVMRHQYRVLSQDEKEKMQKVKDMGLEFWNLIDSLGTSRELSNAKTRIEEAVMWGVKHLTA
jgi:hypothetical protein